MVIGLIYLILLISQLGKHFWPSWSFVEGIKVDYLSPTLYITDVVWIIAFLKRFKYKKIRKRSFANAQDDFGLRITKSKKDSIVMLSLLFFFNVILANRWQVAVYGWFRLWQVWWWAGYFSKRKKEIIRFLGWVIPWWIGLETFLALGQVVSGGSLGGIFYWLGERKFDYMSLGIARISWFGDQYVRAYGTFSHPNSLAGFLLVGIVMWNRNAYMRSLLYRWMINWLGVVGIILTGSRLVWVVGIIILLLRFKIRLGWKLIGVGIGLMCLSFLLANFEIAGGWSVNSLDLRWKLLKSGWSMWRQKRLLGVGLNNFLVNLPDFMKGYWWLQPVHNIFVLLLVETGLVGLILIGVFLAKKVDFKKYRWVWVVIILTGMFDHYWLTLPQNMGLLGLVLGLSMRDRATKG